MSFFLCVIGMVLIVEGLPYFAFPETMKAMVVKLIQMKESTLRMLGFSLMLAGLVLIAVGRT